MTAEVFNLCMDLFGMFICIFAIVICILCRKINAKLAKIFMAIFSVNMLLQLSNFLGLIYRGVDTPLARTIIPIANFFEFFLAIIVSFALTMYLLYAAKLDYKKKRYMIVYLFYIVDIVLLIVSQFNHMFYYIDEANVYHRGELFYISNAFGILFMICDLIIFIVNYKRLTKIECIGFSVYVILPVIALILQFTFYGIYFLLISTTLGIITMLVIIFYDQIKKYMNHEKDMADAKIKLMITQIQPHFIYNSLTAIVGICDDSAKTKNAINDFAKYLRGNLESLTVQEPILFEKELAHIKVYLNLEKLRFGDLIQVKYDIRFKNFSIPALTVQMLVENAIKHGISVKPEGGHILIRTEELKNYISIQVIDDGAGFDSIDNNKIHIGLNNLRNRLESMVNGKLIIDSKVGRGTKVKILIPRGNIQ